MATDSKHTGAVGHELSVIPDAPQNQTGHHPQVPITIEEPESQIVPQRTRFQLVTSLLALFSSLFIAALNSTIVGVAIPTIVRELNGADGYAWIGGAYLLGNAAAAPIWAKLSDIWGRKPMLLAAVAGYFFSSIICALATNMRMLIAGRALQGIAGGGVLQLVNIVISDLFSVRHRSLYLALCEIIWGLAAGIGPVLGGALSQQASWRWIFWICLPVCFIAFTLLLFALKVHNPHTPLGKGLKAIDWAGSASMLALLVMFLTGLSLGGSSHPWGSPTVLSLIIIGLAMAAVFVLAEAKVARYPLMPLGLFSCASNVAVLIITFAQDFALMTTEYYLPLWLQSVRAASPVRAGVLILPSSVGIAATGLLAGLLVHRTGRYLELIYAGLVLTTLGFGLLVLWDAGTSVAMLAGLQVLAAVGMGCLFTPPLLALQAMVSQDDVATATGTLGLVRNVANILAVVSGQAIFQNQLSSRGPELLAAGLSPEVAGRLSGPEAASSLDLIAGIEDAGVSFRVRNVFSEALRYIWVLDTVLCGFGLLASMFVAKTTLSKVHVETRTGLEKEEEKRKKAKEGKEREAELSP